MAQHARVRAPELTGKGGWLNTGGTSYTLADLRGRIVILDFWTFCCVNCLHVLDELRELEEKHRDTVVVIGVHSPKFVHEAEHQAVVDAVERYEVHHPVLDDPELATWKQYAVRAWPTLVVIDPEGYVVAQHAGEGHAHAIERLVSELEEEHAAKGTLRRGEGPYVAPEPVPTDLRFPGKAVRLPGGTFLVSDSTRHALVELAADGETVVRRIGSGERGLADGGPAEARFSEPQGLALLPDGRVVVADTVNHALRSVDVETGRVTTVAGTGLQWWQGSATSGPARETDLSSPWDVAWFADRLWIAMAGVHQLWTWTPPADGDEDGDGSGTVEAVAGTTNEGLVDGPAAEAWFAQPSGLAAAGDRLWIADSETSALRWIERAEPDDPEERAEPGAGGREFTVRTAVGTGLFDFGHRDGPAGQALLQHPLGVTALPDGSVAVSDTYNHALRRYDPATGEVTTLATDLREPSDAVLDGDGIVVVESARHRLTRLRLPEEAVRVEPVAHRTQRAATEVAPGRLRLDVVFRPPAGQKLDERYGPATRLVVSATPPELLAEGSGTDTGLGRDLVLAEGVTEGVLHVSAMAASCDDDPAQEYPACHVHQQDWGVPVTVAEGGADRLPLVLAGLDAP
ncbi:MULTISPECIES: NHL domain-containing thioredoxin family protein [Streptomyces]|uniref:Alkyl hydroperoxide reductase n=2 Tax=Streptomyces TaxID=1883 RepID=A0A3M8EZE4_9ACTN|nr:MULTISPECIES: NHL domain-containing thioredoxin family protein [Streptomyces]KNE80268.1 alkyl hydroperoxide reductase / thiol specific antioxidant / Mal allergen [Streptomyces fradiae]OFA33948.1 alkyl hydroperoxide reductase [Streptomyces fradiae]PQM20490.1 alkyl hydroperoxide reductase [Streptomyces xinghaiensis]RKM91300.1 alkyl hydroperoxide reductase [Streptomyces xinghaiensis]RNC69794.1 alkyl hydroperoxide reductase [Streptomyces xinghaiensis]